MRIATSLLLPGWEHEYDGRPPIDRTLCVGRVISHSRDDDDKYNILIVGLSRARLIHELPPERSFREARVKLVQDIDPGAETDLVFRMKRGVGIYKDRDGIVYKNVLATYMHIHALGTTVWAGALVRNAAKYQMSKNG